MLPLKTGELRAGLSQRAVAAVFIADAVQPAQIAAQLGLAPSTVKTHLLRVFDKTGCKRQADRVRLAASLSA